MEASREDVPVPVPVVSWVAMGAAMLAPQFRSSMAEAAAAAAADAMLAGERAGLGMPESVAGGRVACAGCGFTRDVRAERSCMPCC